MAPFQKNKFLKEKNLSACPLSSCDSQNFLQFLFLLMHQHIHIGAISHIVSTWGLPWMPLQLAENSISLLGMTHDITIPTKKSSHMVLTTSQCNSRWFIVTHFFLHVQHQFNTMIRCFLKLSTVRVLPKEAVETKRLLLKEL